MAHPPYTAVDLKKVKNKIIGNRRAKLALVQDEALIRSLVAFIESKESIPAECRVESANILASLGSDSEPAVLSSLLRQHAIRALTYGLRVSSNAPNIQSAYARALRSLISALADLVGPSEFSIGPRYPTAIRLEAKDALANLHTNDTLDTILPLLHSPTVHVVTSISQLVASSARIHRHRALISSWVPPSERDLAREATPSRKRGWETISSPTHLSPIARRDSSAADRGGWVVRSLLGTLETTKDVKLQEATLLALASLSKDNFQLASSIRPRLSLIHGHQKSRSVDVQIAACLCAAYSIRASYPTAASSHSSAAHLYDYGHTPYAQMPQVDLCIGALINFVNRTIPNADESLERRIRSCYALQHLIRDDRALCRFAFDRGCLDVLAGLLKSITPLNPGAEWDESEAEGVTRLREATLTTIATLAMFDGSIRRSIADAHELLPYIRTSIRQGALQLPSSSSSSSSITSKSISYSHSTISTSTSYVSPTPRRHAVGVRYGACQCIRVLARGVEVVRTSVVDSGLGMEVFEIVAKAGQYGLSVDGTSDFDGEGASGPEAEDPRVVGAALKAVCNLVMDFSPLRTTFVERGLPDHLNRLMLLTEGEVERSGEARDILIDVVWVVQNLFYKADGKVRREVMARFGWERVSRLLTDPDWALRELGFGIIQNLAAHDGAEEVFRSLPTNTLLDAISDALGYDDLADATPVSPVSPPSVGDVLADDVSRRSLALPASLAFANLCSAPGDASALILSNVRLLSAVRASLSRPVVPVPYTPGLSASASTSIAVGALGDGAVFGPAVDPAAEQERVTQTKDRLVRGLGLLVDEHGASARRAFVGVGIVGVLRGVLGERGGMGYGVVGHGGGYGYGSGDQLRERVRRVLGALDEGM